jgi:glucose/arabinose dehydrogenase
MKRFLVAIVLMVPAWGADEFYTREEIPTPPGEVMEISSIALLPDEKVAVSTRRGDIWICNGAYGDDLSKVTWKKIAEGLHEPLGMFWQDGWLWLTQRPEVSKLRDTDGDGEADEFVTIASPWGMSGDYHEYAFGSRPDAEGNVWVALCLTGSFTSPTHSPYRGWAFKVSPDGESEPIATGLRSPGGVGFNAQGDAFFTDNQGPWNGSSSLKHLKPGHFMGHPAGNKHWTKESGVLEPPLPQDKSRMVSERKRHPALVPPAVVFPHGLVGQSPSGIVLDETDGRFGPFEGQLFVGEQTHSQVQRVFLEKVNGTYQGAVWHFAEGFRSGIVPMRLADDGTLFVGGTNRGWAARGGKNFTFERTRWTGVVPFTVEEMRLTKDGWDLTFTKPVKRSLAGDPNNYEMEAWTYIYQAEYGSPQVDQTTPKVTSAEVSDDKLTVSLKVDGRVKGHVHELDCARVLGAEGESVWHPKGYYTLNEWVE